ncbi:efflux transporter outer membrane subunit [Photobacterium sanguinicancri]|uniref:Efflux transporter outer membrane subunit n=1 Tax=Photobacterium sanguinicancri TaxID=875932 RepID=A0AAW7Y5T0_9GAMM|nr:efflux transporter outer membrane subunit [Photobacterium sanguinicancri]MDO6542683.1 efflux transporter outer membrane subunit [Photobacterium sanguinicancri]
MTFSTTRKLAPIALAMLLTGCAVGPDYQAPMVSIAESYLHTNTTNTASSDLWWQQLNDDTLNMLINDMQQQNVSLKVAAERIKMANQYQTMVASFKVPTISVGAGYYNYQISKNDSLAGPLVNPIAIPPVSPQLPSNVTLMDNQHDGGYIGASIAWELDLFGRIDRQADAAQIRVEQAEIMTSGLHTLLTADLLHNYLQYRGAQERKALAQANIEDQRKTRQLIKKVVKSGYGSQLDYAQATAALAATEALIPQLEIAEQAHKHRIALLLNEPLTQVDIRLARSERLPTLQGVIPTGLPSDLLKRRPDIRAAEREMAAVNEELAASIANRYPKFFLTGTPGVSASSFDDLFSSDSFGWAGSVGINWNVFDGGRGKAAVKMNEARFQSAALQYEHTVNAAITEVDSSLFAYGRSQETQKQIDEALAATDLAVSKAKSLYKAGLIDHLSVLDAQRQQRMVQDSQLAARLQTANITIAVYKALGGDWQITPTPSEQQPIPTANSNETSGASETLVSL